jgi:Dolichyl-phosphate-mannose-protein mannosyltransferase
MLKFVQRVLTHYRYSWHCGLVIIVLCFLVQTFGFALQNGPTYDEQIGYEAGYQNIFDDNFYLNFGHPPVWRQLAVYSAWMWSVITADELPKTIVDHVPLAARAGNMALGAAMIVVLADWVRRMWNKETALLIATLAAFEPTIIANFSVVTPDAAVTFFVFLSAYLYWRYLHAPTWWLLIGTGLVVGLASMSKFSAPPFLIIVYLGGLLANKGRLPWPALGLKPAAIPWWGVAACTSVWVLLLALVVVGLYGWHNLEYLWAGVHSQLQHSLNGQYAYFFGQASTHTWRLYFPVAYLIKTPLTILCAIMIGCVTLLRAQRFEMFVWCILIPGLFFEVLAFSGLNIGVRYALPAFPFLLLLAAAGAHWVLQKLAANTRGFVLCVVLSQLISVVPLFPHYLAYANEIFGGPGNLHHYLVDSNIDWGQDFSRLKKYMIEHGVQDLRLSAFSGLPVSNFGINYQAVTACYEMEQPTTLAYDSVQLFAISITVREGGCTGDVRRFAWLKSRLPVAVLGYSIYIYDITNDAEAHRELAALYNRMRWYRHMRHELVAAMRIDQALSRQ